jgi:spermidine/putrescine transport system substrate-binding protein
MPIPRRRPTLANLRHAPRFAALLAAAACGGAEPPVSGTVEAYGLSVARESLGGDVFNLFTWPDYLDPELVREFEDAYGVRVQIDYYDTNEVMIAKLQAGGTGQYDLVVGSDYAVAVLVEQDLLEPLDLSLIPNLDNLDERFAAQSVEGEDRYAVPYLWGTSGLGVRSDLVPDGAPESWALVFDPGEDPGPFTMMNDVRETIGAALLYLGHSANSTDPGELAEAERLLMEQRGRVLTYAPFATARDLLGSGDAHVVHNFSGDILMLREEVPEVRYVIPREGAIVWTDNMAVPRGAPHKRLAEVFVNFILDPRVGARLSEFAHYPTPNRAALPLVDAELRADRSVYPDSAVLERLEVMRDVGEARALYDRIWTRLRAGAGGG